MTNKEIASLFNELAALMELHGENAFRIKSYANAYLNIRKTDVSLAELSLDQLSSIKGIGKTIAEKIVQIQKTGSFDSLEQLRLQTPDGVRAMLRIKGVGPKKILVFWKEMGIETIGELMYACKENRLIHYKGFGPKIQEDILKTLEFHQSQSHLFNLAFIERDLESLVETITRQQNHIQIQATGKLKRKTPILDLAEFIVSDFIQPIPEKLEIQNQTSNIQSGIWCEYLPVQFRRFSPPWTADVLIKETGGSEEFFQWIGVLNSPSGEKDESAFFKNKGLPYVHPECRDLQDFHPFVSESIITEADIKGVIHNHSLYSDGACSIRQMAEECIRLGYQYLVMSDHSRSAFYANGLSIERVEMQWREIEDLNTELKPFHIYKSIESDILGDGALDYPEDILSGFDLVIASIHSNLKMTEEKAMERLKNAIHNKHTRILGHPTGRLLLSRKGYPIDHRQIIDCCYEKEVAIELNANPMRLDLDWSWIAYAQEKGVLISINPDAHNLSGIADIRHGVNAARKGGLRQNNCLNFKSTSEFNTWILSKK